MTAVFDAIAVTAATQTQAKAFKLELELRRKLGLIPAQTLVLAVPDPASVRIGSGGATLNALAVASQALCAREGARYLDRAFLRGKRILVLHSGGDSQRIPICSVRGKAFSSLPCAGAGAGATAGADELLAPIDFLLQRLTELFVDAPPGGLVVASTDVMLLIPCERFAWRAEGVTGFAVPTDAPLGCNHGVYVADEAGRVTRFLQKPSLEEMRAAGAVFRRDGEREQVLLDSGIVLLSAALSEQLLDLGEEPPLSSCTSSGLDQGQTPVRFELYTDVLLALNGLLSQSDYFELPLPAADADPVRVLHVRQALWRVFSTQRLHVCTSAGARFAHLGTTAEYRQLVAGTAEEDARAPETREYDSFRRAYALVRHARSFVEWEGVGRDAVLINSLLEGHGRVEAGALVEDSRLGGNFLVARGAVCSGVRSFAGLLCAPDTVVQEQSLSTERILGREELARALNWLGHGSMGRLAAASGDPETLGLATTGGAGGGASGGDRASGAGAAAAATAAAASYALQAFVVVVFGVHDRIKEHWQSARATLLGRPWADFMRLHQVTAADLWAASVPERQRTLWNARLYPVLLKQQRLGGAAAPAEADLALWMQEHSASVSPRILRLWRARPRLSLEDVLALADPVREFRWRRSIAFQLDVVRLEDVLLQRKNESVLDVIRRWDDRSAQETLLATLDNVAASASFDVAARALCAVGDVLISLPGTQHLVRFGPHHNPAWASAMARLAACAPQTAEQRAAVEYLARLRAEWMHEPDLAVRACRHYDGASQVLIGRCVEDAPVAFSDAPLPRLGQWVRVSVPARLDLAGGWSDTPPISFEHGGVVVNVAVLIDGRCPVGASARRLREPALVLRALKLGAPSVEARCTSLAELGDYSQPSAPAALLKSVLVCMGLVRLDADAAPLAKQLAAALNAVAAASVGPPADAERCAGLEVETWSALPEGTGLGVSSIMAAAAVSAVARCVGRRYDAQSLTHMVLRVEQAMSTGGGWQDQVGGALPGFKVTRARPALPVVVHAEKIAVSAEATARFEQHAVLLNTGKSRLAKTLLQSVVRRWYHRTPEISRVVDELCVNAERMAGAVAEGSPERVGELLNAYWAQKKVMATDAEPPNISRLMAALQPLAHGMSLCGAGGGGFMLVLTKQPDAADTIRAALRHAGEAADGVTVHAVHVSAEGLQLRLDHE